MKPRSYFIELVVGIQAPTSSKRKMTLAVSMDWVKRTIYKKPWVSPMLFLPAKMGASRAGFSLDPI